MELGSLQIPKPEMEKHVYVQDLQTKLFFQYLTLVEKSDLGKKVLKILSADQRVKILENTMISKGNSAIRFEIKNLAMWVLWAINEFGLSEAERNLNVFLDSTDVPVINTLWVLGVKVDSVLELQNGYKIVPLAAMPDSSDKEYYLRHDFGNASHYIPKPQTAITYECNIPKSLNSEEIQKPPNIDTSFNQSSRKLHEISLLLNTIEGVSCIPYFSTAYNLSSMPLGMFLGGGGGSSPIYDVVGSRTNELKDSIIEKLNHLVSSLNKLNVNEKDRILRILNRFSQAKRRSQIEDKILDLGICLEMALLDDNKNLDQLSLTFRLRGSWLIGINNADRKNVFNSLKDIYRYRCQVAHSGILSKNKPKKINAVRAKFHEYSIVTERIIYCLITKGRPNWANLILGIV